MGASKEYDLVIVGAGLAGLTAAYTLKKLKPKTSILVIERSGTAGGLTGNWVDHRLGTNKKLQMPMHMIFNKYVNLVPLVEEIGGEMTPVFPGFTIITGDEVRHRLEMNDWTSRHLPPPFHSLGMFAKLKLPLRSKWGMMKLAAVATYCADKISHGIVEPPAVPNTLSLEGLGLLLHMDARSRHFMEAVTPSIYNTHPWYTSAPRIATVMAGTMTLHRNALHYRVFAKNYNSAFIDRFVEKIRRIGVEFRFWTEARRLESDTEGQKIKSVWIKSYGPEAAGSSRYMCDNCGAENYSLDRAFCTRCGVNTTLSRTRAGQINKPASENLWENPAEAGCEEIRCHDLITAVYPHMIAPLLPDNSPLRRHAVVRSYFSSRGSQTQLSIARVYYGKSVTDEREITGTHNPSFAFNGCQSVFNNFGAEDLGHRGDVIDVLLDVGIIQDAWNREEIVQRIIKDLNRVYPAAKPSLVENVSFAKIHPKVLYLTEQTAITGLHRSFNTHRTGVSNWYVAGCHSGMIGIGMESAVESGLATVNCLLQDAGQAERAEIRPYTVPLGSHLLGLFGRALLVWKGHALGLQRLR